MRRWRAGFAIGAATFLLAGCTDSDADGSRVSVFDLEVGMCVLAPAEGEVAVEMTEVATVPCDQPHHLEVFALVQVPEAEGTDEAQAGTSFPGDAALKDAADGACAEEFADYVGIDYRDSDLWFTYLVPSARGWETENDRTITCLITTTGEELTVSVAGTGW